MKLALSAADRKFTVLFEAAIHRGEIPTVFTEYVYAPKDDEKTALLRAMHQATDRLSQELNIDKHRLMVRFMSSKKLLNIADGWVSLTHSHTIQKRRRIQQ